MAKKKLNLQAFETCRIVITHRRNLKGGYKSLPQGVQGSNFIGTTVDIRNENRVEPVVPNLPNAIDYLILP